MPLYNTYPTSKSETKVAPACDGCLKVTLQLASRKNNISDGIKPNQWSPQAG